MNRGQEGGGRPAQDSGRLSAPRERCPGEFAAAAFRVHKQRAARHPGGGPEFAEADERGCASTGRNGFMQAFQLFLHRLRFAVGPGENGVKQAFRGMNAKFPVGFELMLVKERVQSGLVRECRVRPP